MSGIYDEYEPYYSKNTMPQCGLKPILFNKETREIINKNDIFAYGILMLRKYSKSFIEKGTIKFGCPYNWINYAKNHAPGKGDVQEGVFAAYNLTDIEGIKKGLASNPGSKPIRLVSTKSDLIYLVNESVIRLPTYCFYIIRTGDFKIVRYGGSEYTAFLSIPPRYFRGLADGKTWLESTKDDYDEQYVFVTIFDHGAFLDRIGDRLIKIGVSPNEAIGKPIKYINMDIPFPRTVDHPCELFLKNKQFEDQHEGRIVINSSNQRITNYLLQNTIDIGSLQDICVLFDQYPAGGLNFFIDLDDK